METFSVLDVGASGGPKAMLPHFLQKRPLADALPLMRLYGVEPSPRSYENLKALGLYHDIWPEGAADKCGPRSLYITRIPGCSSIFEPDLDVLNQHLIGVDISRYYVERVETVECVTLDVFRERAGERFDWIKLDTQGSEYAALSGSPETVSEATVVFAELSSLAQYKGQGVTADCVRLMNDLGFEILHWHFKHNLPCESEAVFIRRWSLMKDARQLTAAETACTILGLDNPARLIRNHLYRRLDG